MAGKAHLIMEVEEGSIAEEMGVRPGDKLVEINGQPVEDVLEYKFLINDEYVEVLIQKPSGEEWLLEVDKEPHEDLGLVFETGLMDRGKRCKNKCVFCFIDQLPRGMRESLYFKDDDSRLSFLQGNFISLTNLETEDLERIIKYRISPLNVSVHTTNPDLRVKMLGSPKAGASLQYMRLFLENGLSINCQIVLCPGLNDGENLEQTLGDLFNMGEGIRSIGVVPVGITKFRKGLYPLRAVDKHDAEEALKTVSRWQDAFLQRYGSRIVYAADELYLKAGQPLPPPEAYENFPQLENGIGMMALFGQQFQQGLKGLGTGRQTSRRVSVATGTAACRFIESLVRTVEEKVPGLKVQVFPITNNFFGQTIDVAGLITGGDLMEQLQGKDLGARLIIPRSMLKSGEEVFLDDVSVPQVEKRLGVRVEACEVHGGDFLRNIIREGAQ
ncbi:MAG TPA: DUF512 domain-containing protein [Bacillota bacterium]|nr:DUF512 domain-containing protein [Bacillota bacterium]